MKESRIYTKPIRWGIIGCGDVTEVKSGPAYQITEGFELTAVMRRDYEKLKDYAARHKVPKIYADAEELIHDDEIDAIYIATPPDSHLYYGLKVAESGKPCCIEKPLTPSYRESLALFDAFKSRNVPLFSAYYRRSLPRFTHVQSWLKKKSIGNIRHISWQLIQPPSELDLSGKYNWRTDKEVAPGGYFDDLASHGLDLFTWYLGDIKEAFGVSTNQQELYSAKDSIAACWIHKNGITGEASWNFGGNQSIDRVEIFGSLGKIQFSIFEDNPIILEARDFSDEKFIEHPGHVQLPHVENMSRHFFEEGYIHPSMGENALHTSWVMDCILGKLTTD